MGVVERSVWLADGASGPIAQGQTTDHQVYLVQYKFSCIIAVLVDEIRDF